MTTIRLKRGLESAILPLNLPLGEPVWASDTNRLFVGTGSGVTPVKITLDDLIAVYNVAGSLVQLDANGLIPTSLLPAITINAVYAVADIPARDALTPNQGDMAIVASTSQTFIWDGTAWQELLYPVGVSSVNAKTGAVVLELADLSDVGSAVPSTGHVLTWDGSEYIPMALPSSATTFVQLTDTPSSYTGFGGQFIRINAAETELEFTDEIDGGTV